MLKQKLLEKNQLSYNIWLVLFWVLSVISGLSLIIGFFLFLNGNEEGLLVFLISTAVFVTILILFLKARKKYLPVINGAFIEIINEAFSLVRGESKFVTNTANSLSFTNDGILIDNTLYPSDKCFVIYGYEVLSSLMLDKIVFSLFISAQKTGLNNGEEFLSYVVKIDGDLLNALNTSSVEKLNQIDFDYFVKNLSTEAPKILKKAVWNVSYLAAPITCQNAYVKENSSNLQGGENLQNAVSENLQNATPEVKSIKTVTTLNAKPLKTHDKTKTVTTLKVVGLILLSLVIPILLVVILKSEEGVKLLDSNAFKIILKIAFTIAVICVALVKAEKISVTQKIVTLSYAVVYWIALLFLPNRVSYILNSLFSLAFLVFAVYDGETKTFNFKDGVRPRYFVLGGVTLLFALTSVTSLTMLDDSAFFVETLIFVIVTLIVGLIIAIKKIRKNETQTKGKKAGTIAVTVLCLITFGFLIGYFGLLGANYAFDTSKPEVIESAVTKLELGDDNSSSTATVFVDGKEIEVSISDAEFYEYKIGDTITLYKYKGALNKEYVTTSND